MVGKVPHLSYLSKSEDALIDDSSECESHPVKYYLSQSLKVFGFKSCNCKQRFLYQILSCSNLYFLCFVFIEYGQGVSWVGSLCLFFYDLGICMFRPSMVLNQRLVSLVVSD